MKEFNNFEDFAKHIEKLALNYPIYEEKMAAFIGEGLEKEAKDKFGHLQDAAGEFEAWRPLAESTIKQKTALGYIFNADSNPLYRTGETRDTIHHVFNLITSTLFLGSASDIMMWQEEGTPRGIPPRSVIGATMFQAIALINYAASAMLKDWLCGERLTLRHNTYGRL